MNVEFCALRRSLCRITVVLPTVLACYSEDLLFGLMLGLGLGLGLG